MDAPGSERIYPREIAGHHREPGRGIRLDNVWRGAAGVPPTLNDLDGTERWHPHLDGASRCAIGEALQGPTNGHATGFAIIGAGARGVEGGDAGLVGDPLGGHEATVALLAR